MTPGDWAQLVVGAAALVLAGIAAFFAWRDWERGRALVDWEFRAAERPRDVTGAAGYALALDVMLRCKRGSIYIRRITLGHDKKRQTSNPNPHLGDLDSGRPLEIGDAAWITVFADALSQINESPNGPIRVACYLDAEGRQHCRPVPRDKLREVLASTTRPEREGETDNGAAAAERP